jgi:hypothetical protein
MIDAVGATHKFGVARNLVLILNRRVGTTQNSIRNMLFTGGWTSSTARRPARRLFLVGVVEFIDKTELHANGG